MKKTKAPILLGTLVGTLLLTLAAINMTGLLSTPGQIVDIKASNQEAYDEISNRQDQIVGPNGETLASATGTKTFGPEGTEEVAATEIPARPTVKLPDTKEYEPNYDASRVSSHWYDGDSYQKKKAEEDATSR